MISYSEIEYKACMRLHNIEVEKKLPSLPPVSGSTLAVRCQAGGAVFM